MFVKIQSNLKFVLFSLIALSLFGCGATPNYYLTPQTSNNIGSTDVFVTMPQKEIAAEIDQSSVAASGGGGLLFALIDVAVENSRANTAEELIQPIKDSLVELDFNELFLTSLKTKLSTITWLNVQSVTNNLDLEEKLREKSFTDATAKTVLYIDTKYALNPNFSAFKAYANLSLIPKSAELKQYSEKPDSKGAKKYAWHVDNSLYRDNVVISEIISGTTSDKELNATHLKNNSELVKSRFVALAEALADEIVSSIQKTRAVKAG